MLKRKLKPKMEGKHSNSQRIHLLKKIRDFTRAMIVDLHSGRSPLIYIDRFRNYCTDSSGTCCCSYDLVKGKEILTLQRECQAHRIDVLLRVILIVQQLLQENKHGSKRDIYYMHPSVFREQSVVDRAINDICILLQCSRHNLNIVSVGNGLVMGWLRFSEGGRKFDCINSPNSAHPVPVHVEEVKDVTSVAEYILVVEKESVFQRLANDHFCKRNRCIVITGRGYPDVPTRRFLRLLIDQLYLPVYCLVDCDPYGFDILATYRFGSMQMAYDAKLLRLPDIRWLGAFPSDSEKYGLPQQCLLPLTAEDKTRTEALLQRCYLQREEPQWRPELESLLQRGVKFEIEALCVHSLSFLSEEYLPAKIRDLRSLLELLFILHTTPAAMQPLADIACQLKVDVHCDSCKRSLMEVLRSIRGVYSVSIEVQQGRDGIAKVAGEVDPNMLLGALARSGKHAELLNVRIRHPRLRNLYSDDDHNYYNYGSSIISRYNPLSYGRSGSLPASAYYEVDQDYYPYGRRSLVEYPYSYSDNYDNRPLPRAIYVPSYPPQVEIYNDHNPISFCSIL